MVGGRDRYQTALALVNQGLRAQQQGALEQAVELYRRSLALAPTAEAHTYLGWALSYQGELEEAIAQCRQAIALDPTFGNPYNDIGVYLMQQGRSEEAIPWLEQAKHAPRYEPRHYPYINLARIYAASGQLVRAVRELEGALALVPQNGELQEQLEELRRRLN
ncbi:MAG TPA: tetratricopeptide repeat protein [Candidatus Binataceae bacterium]|nr:tetratricopeptide repeat protein [Candidatus Binataceae bacterium]